MFLEEQKIFNYLSKLQADFTVNATTDIITSSAHGLVKGDKIQLTTSTTLPAGLSLATDYFVINPTADTFQLSATVNGPAINITGTGTGTHTFHLKGKVILCEGFQHIELSFDSANNANLTAKVQYSNSKDCPDFNAAVSAINRWYYAQIKNLDDGTSINGSTGIAPSGTDFHKCYEINVNKARFVTLEIPTFTAGTLNAFISLGGKYNN